MRERERADDQQQLPHRATEQQQPDEKQQMIRPDQNMVDAVRHEPGQNGQDSRRGTRVVVEPDASPVENRLGRDPVAFVEIDERLMHRVIGEHARGHADDPRRAVELDVRVEANRLALCERLGSGPRADRERPAVHAQLQPVGEKRRERGAARGEPLRVEQLLRRLDPEIVGDVEDVRDERQVERAWLDADVEVAEWNRMRRRRRGEGDSDQRQNRPDEPQPPHFGLQW